MTQSEILAAPRFRLLLVPFSGPIPKAGTPGLDLDGDYFSPRTEIGRGLYDALPLRWHHGRDPVLGNTRLGTAVLDRQPKADGWWATCTWTPDEPAVELVRALGARVAIFGSSQPIGDTHRTRTGEITRWHVAEATLSSSPQNIAARLEAA